MMKQRGVRTTSKGKDGGGIGRQITEKANINVCYTKRMHTSTQKNCRSQAAF